ncbi:MAG: DoxX family membrane protein [Gemmatimonadales bacterium]|nr:DoxX family membrane protein [Gemmatimonadales bacterium]NIN10651.1 DoxX family membrane protein [Gemmatimonadales bacterium]NIN49413.1 DoxX family membrane protein [Gemmatimonadales bacterium]NIP06877.1 DoxX family membrane protein [Gemmatimonadales bacterium]NIR01551.1 DoxX family membrane protein [Gemmatimonadales bacterium]
MLQLLSKLEPIARNAMRVMVGLLFWSHGGQKLFAWFGRDEAVDLMSRFGIAGVLEFFGGLAIILGIFTQPVAFILSGEMAVAYFWGHVPRGSLWWWANRGELAALYCFIFLFIASSGGGKFSLDHLLRKKKQGRTEQ